MHRDSIDAALAAADGSAVPASAEGYVQSVGKEHTRLPRLAPQLPLPAPR